MCSFCTDENMVRKFNESVITVFGDSSDLVQQTSQHSARKRKCEFNAVLCLIPYTLNIFDYLPAGFQMMVAIPLRLR